MQTGGARGSGRRRRGGGAVIGPEGTGGLITETEFELARFCTEETLSKKVSDRLIGMQKWRAFIMEDLRADSIRETEKMISHSSVSKISEFDLWRKIDGIQDVKGNLRSLLHIVEDLLAELGYRDLQYIHFEHRQVDGQRVSGVANGAFLE